MNTRFEKSVRSSDEWYTPKEVLKALGRFDLDPCAPCDSKMFQDVIFEKATGMKFLRHRIRFYRPDGTRGDSPGCGSILIAFGVENAEVLKNCSIEGKYVQLN